MDKRIEWPWSLEEEAEWKSDLEEQDQNLVDELMSDTVEDLTSSVPQVRDDAGEVSTEESLPEKYSVTA